MDTKCFRMIASITEQFRHVLVCFQEIHSIVYVMCKSRAGVSNSLSSRAASAVWYDFKGPVVSGVC